MKILIVKTSSLGDVIHMLPAVTDACKVFPDLQVDWLVEESFAAIPAWHSAVQQVIPIAMRRWKKNLLARTTRQQIGGVRDILHSKNYDLVLDSQGLVKSALWTLIPQSTSAGYDRQSIREPLASFFYDRRVRVSKAQHAVERNRQLTALALGYRVPDVGPDYGLQSFFSQPSTQQLEIPSKNVLGLHGTSRSDKLWPVQGWVALANALGSIGRTLILPWGNEDEHQRARYIAEQGKNILVLPKLDLNSLGNIINQAEAVVGVDTGLLHLAAALGKPGLGLYTATPPALTGAVSDRHAPMALHNLANPLELSPQAVSESILHILKP